jgi:undecaprenyl diphosphate synthase
MSQTLPTHIGIILDGNRRWARARGVKSTDGHKEGAETFKRVALEVFDAGIPYLSAYVFSTENWQRTKDEVSFLMKLLFRAVELHLDEFHQKNIRIVVAGSRNNVPASVLKMIDKTVAKTMNNSGGTLVLCFNYGGKQEIVDATNKLLEQGVSNVTADELSAAMYCPEVPPLDVVIRTSGESRTSGFMLWRSDYAELIFVDTLWPDFSSEDLQKALEEYSRRKRRFGK